MKFHFYNNVFYEMWDYRSPDLAGIGGSELNNIEMAWRLAKRGHEVTCYAPIPPDCKREWRGTHWKMLHEAFFEDEGIWVLVRNGYTLDWFPKKRRGQRIWLISHDVECRGITEDNSKRLDKFIALGTHQADGFIQRQPFVKKKVFISSNGVKVELIRELEDGRTLKRNPLRLIFSSAPYKGLENLLKIFKAAKKEVPGLSLHIFYGWDFFDAFVRRNPDRAGPYKKLKRRLKRLLDQPDVVWHGRTPQKRLYLEWLKSGIWCHPTSYLEVNPITCMEAQALGAIPITNPSWGLKETARHGILIEGDPADPRIQKRYAYEIVRMATDLDRQEAMREKAMKDARIRFDWEKVVDQWESWLPDSSRKPLA